MSLLTKEEIEGSCNGDGWPELAPFLWSAIQLFISKLFNIPVEKLGKEFAITEKTALNELINLDFRVIDARNKITSQYCRADSFSKTMLENKAEAFLNRIRSIVNVEDFDRVVHSIVQAIQTPINIEEHEEESYGYYRIWLIVKAEYINYVFDELFRAYQALNHTISVSPAMVLKHFIRKLQASLDEDKQLNVFDDLVFMDRVVTVNKSDSDFFANLMINIYKEKLAMIEGVRGPSSIDGRLPHDATDPELFEYFSLLCQKNASREPYVSLLDIDHFVRANFQCKLDPTQRREIKTNLSNATLRYFLHQFAVTYGTSGIRVADYVNILFSNFPQFRGGEKKTTESHFAIKPAKYPNNLVFKK